MAENVTIFRQYSFRIGEKIHIADGQRRGDWQVVALTDTKVTLQCPKSGRVFSFNRFCYALETREQKWPIDGGEDDE